MLEFVDSGLYFVQDENNFFKSIVTGRIRILIPAFDPILDAIFSIIFFPLFHFFFINLILLRRRGSEGQAAENPVRLHVPAGGWQ